MINEYYMKINRFVFSPIRVNTYLISDENGDCAIIDCGCYDETEFSELKKFISENRLNPVKLLNTHLHLDHIFGNRFVNSEYGLKTHANRNEEENLNSAVTTAGLFGLSMPEPPGIGKYIEAGDIIEIGNIKLECIPVPGHTRGSIAFYCEDEQFVFSGDALFAGSIGRTDLPGGDHTTLINSIRNNLFCLPENTTVFPGHGPSSTIGAESENNPFLT